MRKTYVLDTSTLISDPSAFKFFKDSDVVIPAVVFNELDNVKKQPGEAGRNARVCIKLFDELTQDKDISQGIEIENNIKIIIDSQYYSDEKLANTGFGDPKYGDTQILMCAYEWWHTCYNQNVILVTNDINLRLKARARGVEAIAYEGENLKFNDLYSGLCISDDLDVAEDLQNYGMIDPRIYGIDLFPNQSIVFINENNEVVSTGRKIGTDKLKLTKKNNPWGLSSRNVEQSLAIDLIMDRRIDLVTLVGSAGTGKTLVTLASALELVYNKREYNKLVIYRPFQAVSNDIGYIPGTIQEKLAPWFQAIMDNFETLLSFKNGDSWKRELEMLQKKGLVEMEAITFIRGRSIPNSIILIDEAQNLSKEDMKTILTRAGEGTKIILTGDIEQIDNSDLDATNNGLTYVIEQFKESELAGHITLTKGERSRLASKAAEIM